MGIGADFYYNSAIESQMKSLDRNFRPIDAFQSGIHVSETVVYNKFSLGLHQGVYIGLPERVLGKLIYNKAVMQFSVFKNVNFRIVMKSHLHMLDYPEFGVGIKL